MDKSLPDMGLPHDYLVAIGCVTVQWSFLESTLNGHLREFLAQPQAKRFHKRNLKQPFKRRLELYETLAIRLYKGDARREARMACKLIRAAIEDRHWVAHGTSGQTADGHFFSLRVDELDSGEIAELTRDQPIERLELAARALGQARLLMIDAYTSVMRDFVPSPLSGRGAGASPPRPGRLRSLANHAKRMIRLRTLRP